MSNVFLLAEPPRTWHLRHAPPGCMFAEPVSPLVQYELLVHFGGTFNSAPASSSIGAASSPGAVASLPPASDLGVVPASSPSSIGPPPPSSCDDPPSAFGEPDPPPVLFG